MYHRHTTEYCGFHTDLQCSKSRLSNRYCYLENLWILEALWPPTARLTVYHAWKELEYFCMKHLTSAKSAKVLEWSGNFLNSQGFTPLCTPISIHWGSIRGSLTLCSYINTGLSYESITQIGTCHRIGQKEKANLLKCHKVAEVTLIKVQAGFS